MVLRIALACLRWHHDVHAPFHIYHFIALSICQEQKRNMIPNSPLSVIIPTLNAAQTLPACLASLLPGAALIREIIIVDGGSTDATTSLAANARLIQTPPSRGAQLAAGAGAASGDFLLLLHADTRLSPDWPKAAATAMQAPDYAHYFRFRLDSPARAARILEAIVALRCRLLRLPYGDQALLISRAHLDAVGGIPDIPLMEDVALARRLRQTLRPLAATALTSAARYQRDGFVRRPLRNVVCLTLYYCGVPPARIKKLYG
jgi:rSAM/selenodomain-associated transferase 2